MSGVAFNLILITIISKILGFLRDVVLSHVYGASNISDAYLIALTIPGTIFTFIGTGITTNFIPIYTLIKTDKGKEQAELFTSKLLNILFCISIILFSLCFYLAPQLIKIFASGFDRNTFDIAVRFMRITSISMLTNTVIFVMVSYLQARNSFIIPVAIGIPLNLLIIIAIIKSNTMGLDLLAWGNVIATISQLLLIIPFLYRLGYKYKAEISITDNYIIKFFVLIIPITIGMSINEINVIVDRTIASNIVVGGISALNYSSRIVQFLQALLVIPFITIYFTKMSKFSANKDYESLNECFNLQLIIVLIFITPITICGILFVEPIIKLLYAHGHFNEQALWLTSSTLKGYFVGAIGMGLRELFSRAFYALHDTKTPMINAGISLIINVILCVLLSRYFGIGGIALATSISAILCSFLLFISLKRNMNEIVIGKETINAIIKIVISSVVVSVFSIVLFNSIKNMISESFALASVVIIAAIVYFTLLVLMKTPYVGGFLENMLKKRKLT